MNCGARRDPPERARGLTASSRIAALALAGVCAGCVPLWPHRYYEPSASEGTMPRNRCWRTFETIVIQRGSITFDVRIVPRGDARFVEVAIAVPNGHRVVADDAAITVFDVDGARRPSMAFGGVSLVQSPAMRTRDVRTTLIGETLAGSSAPRNFWLYAPFDAGGLRRFSLVLPAFAIDGVMTELPPIDFARTTRWQFFAPLQC